MVAAAWGWFSWNAYWQSDDFLALQYTQSLANAFSDFWGAQLALPAVACFYRPLITLSWALDGALGAAPPDPLVSHLHNAILHGLNAALVCVVVHRLMNRGQGAAYVAGLVWGLSPAHAGAVAWASGRTGIYATFFMLLSIWFMLRWMDGRHRTRLLSLAFFVLALLSKELAIALPFVILVLGYGIADPRYRMISAWRHGWPYLAVFVTYVIWRLVLFHQIGGYESGPLAPLDAISGLVTWLLRVANPLQYGGYGYLAELTGMDLSWTRWLGYLPVPLAAIAMFRWPDRGMLIAVGLLCLVCAVPTYEHWASTQDLKELRLFYLPGILVAALVSYSWRTGALALLTLPLPFLQLQQDYRDTWQAMRTQHEELQRSASDDTGHDTFFVWGLARQNQAGTVVAFHLGVDRLLRPPFAGAKRCMALRPLEPRPGAYHLPYGDVAGVPFGQTVSFPRPGIMAGLPRASLGHLGLDYRGPEEISLRVLVQMSKGEANPYVRIPGRRAMRYRVTVFTGGGYLTTFLDDEAPAGSEDGMFSIKSLLEASYRQGGKPYEMALALRVPSTLDLDRSFPVLVELDENDHGGKDRPFDPTHANREPLGLRLDRRYGRMVKP